MDITCVSIGKQNSIKPYIHQSFFTADILTCYSQKSPSVTNNNDVIIIEMGFLLFKCQRKSWQCDFEPAHAMPWAIILFIHTCALPTVTCQNVLCLKTPEIQFKSYCHIRHFKVIKTVVYISFFHWWDWNFIHLLFVQQMFGDKQHGMSTLWVSIAN